MLSHKYDAKAASLLPARQGRRAMKSLVIKHSVVIGAHKTSVSLEDAFWKSLQEIAGDHGETLSHLIAAIDADRQHNNLSSALRLFVLRHYRDQFHQPPEREVAVDHSADVSHSTISKLPASP
jgi:predicted DNA-binding ribbon-helix-helix protein